MLKRNVLTGMVKSAGIVIALTPFMHGINSILISTLEEAIRTSAAETGELAI